MYKTIIGVVLFLFVALAIQLYEQDRLQTRIVRQHQEAERIQSDIEAKAEEAEKARQLASGVHSKFIPAADSFVPETFHVPSGAPKEFSITVDMARMTDVRIAGHFIVSGARNTGVEVFIFDEDDYTNWMYGNNSTALYTSGREAMGDVSARIAKSGRYYLIFKNSASTPIVDVQADIQMQYEKVTTQS